MIPNEIISRVWGLDASSWQEPGLVEKVLNEGVPHGLGFAIIKASMGYGNDRLYPQHLAIIKAHPEVLAGSYHWVDPTANMDEQMIRYCTLAEDDRIDFMAADNEQWWSSWDAYYMARNGQISWDVVPRFNRQLLSNFFEDFMGKVLDRIPHKKLFNYTSAGFVASYAPDMHTWINRYPLWVASWPSHPVIKTWEEFDTFKAGLEEPVMPAGAAEWALRQFCNSSLVLPGLPLGVDLSVYYDSYATMRFDIKGDGTPPPPPPEAGSRMRLGNFIALYSGLTADFDKAWPNQCMDLAHLWAYIGLGIYDKSVLSRPIASQVWTNYNPAWDAHFTREANSPTNFPLAGDIIVWSGNPGHIAIAVDADANSFTSFDANWPVGSLPHVQQHNYTNVLGWLHPKNSG